MKNNNILAIVMIILLQVIFTTANFETFLSNIEIINDLDHLFSSFD